MTHQSRAGAVVFAKDLPRVAKFYEEILSMNVAHSERDHVVLESPACQLVVHAIPKKIAASIKISSPPERRAAERDRLGILKESPWASSLRT